MPSPERVRREMEEIDRRIEGLRERGHRIDYDLGSARGRAGLALRLLVCMQRKDSDRQLRAPKLERAALHNCYVQIERDRRA